MEEQSSEFDICILCALSEEAEAVRNEFEKRCQPVSFQSAFTKKRRYPYWHAAFKNLREEPLTILVMAMPFTGPVETPIFAQTLLDEFRPRFIAMTGICAGDRKVAIGDLVVASYAFHHDVGKIETGKEGQDLLRPEWRTSGPQSRIVMYAQALTTWKRPLIEMKQHLLGRDLLLEEHPRCLTAPIASGMAVQGNYPFPRLQEHNRKVEFLDQEVAAFYRTLQELPEVPFLAVKSVCDNGDPAKNDNYHDYAARASAVYLLHFIQEYVNEETMPRRNGPPASDRAGPSSAWNVPYLRNPHFTGRDELFAQLHQQLEITEQNDPITTRRAVLTQPRAIKGLGGIGKTQIAVEYAYRSRELGRYIHTLWINAASEEALITSFTTLAELLPSFLAKNETDQHKLVEAIKHWLEQCKQRWLLIFDNVDNVSMVRKYLPQQGNGSILLTTRADAVGSLAMSVVVEKMGFIEGIQLLLRRAQRFEHAPDEDVNEAGNIVIALDHFPLALDQAGAYIEETGCSLVDYLQAYQNHRKELLARRGLQQTDYPHAVTTTWSLSFQKIEQANPAAAELLRLCAFLAPDTIPEELIRYGAKYWGISLQKAVVDLFTFNQVIEELLKFSLVKRLAETHMFSIHRLVQAVQLDMMEPAVQSQWAERVVRAVNDVFPGDAQDVANWQKCLRYLEQVQACNSLIRQYALAFVEAGDLLNRTGLYLADHASYAMAEPLYQQALSIYEQQLSPEHPSVATSLNNLAVLYDRQGKYEHAEPLYARSLAINTKAYGTEHLSVATGLNNLAQLYGSKGKYTEAEQLHMRALAIREHLLGSQHPVTISSVNNLAILCRDQGKYAQVEPLFVYILAIREQQLGPQHPHTANSLNNLGHLYFLQKKYEQAEPLFTRALAIREQHLGAKHPDTAQSLNNLAALYRAQGKYEAAELLYKRALAIREQHLGAKHPDTAQSLNNLAMFYAQLGNYEHAEALYRRTLSIWVQQLGIDHPHTQTARKNYAFLLRTMGRDAEAALLEMDRIMPS